MASINDLEVPTGAVDLPDDIPEQIGTWTSPPQPGPYRFRLPGDMKKLWDLQDVANEDSKKALRGADKGLRISFSDDSPLVITQSKFIDPETQRDHYLNEAFKTRITVIPRKRDKEGNMVSDMFYLLRSLGHDLSEAKSWTQKQWAEALMTHGGQEFAADIEWSATCSKERVKRIWAGDGGTTEEDPDGDTGCGKRVYQQDIPKDNDGYYMEQFDCPDCKAVLRCWPNLTRFKPISK